MALGASEPRVQVSGEEFPETQAGDTGPNEGGDIHPSGVSPSHPSSPGGGYIDIDIDIDTDKDIDIDIDTDIDR